jgi:tetratricopeptide (TPR) repeat protein
VGEQGRKRKRARRRKSERRGGGAFKPSMIMTPAKLAAASLLVLMGACGQDAEPAIARGDRFWADSNYTAALAEYRLALDQDRNDATLSRVAHAYIRTAQFERARELYDELIAADSGWADQAIFDYVTVAQRAQERADRYGLASAVDAALDLRPGLPLDDFAVPLARYYASTGDPARAIDFYERALTAADPDSVPTLLFEIAQVHEGQGNCTEAIGFFTTFRTRAPRDSRATDANWQIGDCSFQLARQAHDIGDLEAGLRHLDRVIQLGLPQNLIDDAWFERGEILLELGRRDDALFSYVRVLEENPTGTGQIVERARSRIDLLRFGRGR